MSLQTSIHAQRRARLASMLGEGGIAIIPTAPERQRNRELVLKILEETPAITLQGLAKELNISRYSVKEHIERLKRDGVIMREGSDRRGKWILL